MNSFELNESITCCFDRYDILSSQSVVSGTAEPDTIYLTRSVNDHLTIKEKTVGSKSLQIKLSADGGTSTENVEDGAASTCCLSDEDILQLGEIGVQVLAYCLSS